jgi:hypothetical protein
MLSKGDIMAKKENTNNVMIYIAVVAVIVIIAGVFFLVGRGSSQNTSSSSVPTTTLAPTTQSSTILTTTVQQTGNTSDTLFNSGQNFDVYNSSRMKPGYQFVELNVPAGAYNVKVTGIYTMEDPSIQSGESYDQYPAVGILTEAQFGQFINATPIVHSLGDYTPYYNTFNNGEEEMNFSVAGGGVYYLVFYNPSETDVYTVSIVRPVVLQYTS